MRAIPRKSSDCDRLRLCGCEPERSGDDGSSSCSDSAALLIRAFMICALRNVRSTGVGGATYRISSCFCTSKQKLITAALLSRMLPMCCHESRCCREMTYSMKPRSASTRLDRIDEQFNHSRGRALTNDSTVVLNTWIFVYGTSMPNLSVMYTNALWDRAAFTIRELANELFAMVATSFVAPKRTVV